MDSIPKQPFTATQVFWILCQNFRKVLVKEFIFGNVAGYSPATSLKKELFFKLTKNLIIIVSSYGLGAYSNYGLGAQSIIYNIITLDSLLPCLHTFAFWWSHRPPLSANVIIKYLLSILMILFLSTSDVQIYEQLKVNHDRKMFLSCKFSKILRKWLSKTF